MNFCRKSESLQFLIQQLNDEGLFILHCMWFVCILMVISTKVFGVYILDIDHFFPMSNAMPYTQKSQPNEFSPNFKIRAYFVI